MDPNNFTKFKILKESFNSFNFLCSFFSKFSNILIIYSCCGPVKTDFKYKPFKEPQAADAPSNSKPAVKIPFKEPLATDTEKIDREYLIEMCKSLIIQGHLPYVVMSDLK